MLIWKGVEIVVKKLSGYIPLLWQESRAGWRFAINKYLCYRGMGG